MAINQYKKRLSRYCKFKIIDVSDQKTPANESLLQEKQIKAKEGERLLKYIDENAQVIAQAIERRKFTSEKLAESINLTGIQGISHIQYIIGGSLGLSNAVLKQANIKMSVSDMTFPHQLMRVILLEQIYRSYRIIHNEPYHK